MSLYKVGDELLVYLSEDNTEHIVKVSDVDSNDARYTYKTTCLYAYMDKFDREWLNNEYFNILRKVTASDIEAFCKDHDIKFKIGDEVVYEGKTDFIENFDMKDYEYQLENLCKWVDGEDLELVSESSKKIKYSVDDIIIVKVIEDDTQHIVQITQVGDIDSQYRYSVKCLYANYGMFNDSLLDIRDVKILKKATDEDIEEYLDGNGLGKKIGDKVFYNNKRQTIECFDSSDEEYFLKENEVWVRERDLDDSIELSYSVGQTILVNDGDRHILEIVDTDEESDEPYTVKCLYGDYSDYNDKCISESDIYQLLDEDDIQTYLNEYLEIKYRIGQNLIYCDLKCEVLHYDTNNDCYFIRCDNRYELYVSENELLDHSFKEGDLVKVNGFSDTIAKVIYLCSDGEVEVSILICNANNLDSYHNPDNLEIATQKELDYLQKDFHYKIGDKVFYEGEEDTIVAIDNSDKTYLLEYSDDWVSEKEISSIGKKHNFIFKTESKATQIINDETPVAERPKRRLLLG